MYCVTLHNTVFSCWHDRGVDALYSSGMLCYTVLSNGNVMNLAVMGGLHGAALHATGQRVHSHASNVW